MRFSSSLSASSICFRIIAPSGPGAYRYRVEVRGNRLRLLVDGRERNAVTSTRFARGLRVGLFSLASRIQVSGFRVLAL